MHESCYLQQGLCDNKTRRALAEYDNIIRSLYLLDYIDSLPLRRNAQKALNRGENYHQLRKAVSLANCVLKQNTSNKFGENAAAW